MNIIECKSCHKEFIKDFSNYCPYCRTKAEPYNVKLKEYESLSNHLWKKYIVSNIKYLCEKRHMSEQEVYRELNISRSEIINVNKLKEEDPIIEKISDYFGYKPSYFVYTDLRLPKECIELCQNYERDAFATKLLLEIEREGIQRWKRLLPKDAYRYEAYKQIGFKYNGNGFEIRLLGAIYDNATKLKGGCKRIAGDFLLRPSIYIYGLEDYTDRILHSDLDLYTFLLDSILDKMNISIEDWDTYQENLREKNERNLSISVNPTDLFSTSKLIEQLEELRRVVQSELDELETEMNIQAIAKKCTQETMDYIKFYSEQGEVVLEKVLNHLKVKDIDQILNQYEIKGISGKNKAYKISVVVEYCRNKVMDGKTSREESINDPSSRSNYTKKDKPKVV